MARLLGLGSLWISCVLMTGCLALDDFGKFHTKAVDGGVAEDGGPDDNGGGGKGSAGKGGGGKKDAGDDEPADSGSGHGNAGTGGDVDAGSGDDYPIASCTDAIDACGGADAIVGTWGILSSCVDVAPSSGANCPAATSVSSNAHIFGKATFKADRGYTLDFTISQTVSRYAPKDCYPGYTCADILDPDHPELVVDNGTNCTEDGDVSSAVTETGKYLINGGRMTMVPDDTGVTADPFDFCVSGGDVLVGRQISADGTSVTYVAKKQ